MKKYTYLLGALACSALLAGCSADQDFPAVEGKVRMSVKVGRQQIADALTRITIDEQEGNLVCNWAAGDRLLVVNAAGKNVGYMELAQGEENKNFAQFDGYLVLPEGEQTLNFFYLGKTDVKNYPETAGKYVLDMTSQAGKIANLGDYDMLSSQVKVNVADGWAYSDDLSLQRRIAFAHFQLQMPDGVTLTDENVTITGQGVYSKGTYDLTTMATTMTRGTMTVPANGGDFYIDLLPGSDVTPIFAVTVGGVEYEGTLTPKDIQASMFLRKGHQQGVPVQMFRKGGNVDHSLNPLAKWAESNLVYDKSTMRRPHPRQPLPVGPQRRLQRLRRRPRHLQRPHRRLLLWHLRQELFRRHGLRPQRRQLLHSLPALPDSRPAHRRRPQDVLHR